MYSQINKHVYPWYRLTNHIHPSNRNISLYYSQNHIKSLILCRHTYIAIIRIFCTNTKWLPIASTECRWKSPCTGEFYRKTPSKENVRKRWSKKLKNLLKVYASTIINMYYYYLAKVSIAASYVHMLCDFGLFMQAYVTLSSFRVYHSCPEISRKNCWLIDCSTR